jgi:hypothetical protein
VIYESFYIAGTEGNLQVNTLISHGKCITNGYNLRSASRVSFGDKIK